MSFGLEPYLKKISDLEKKLEAIKTYADSLKVAAKNKIDVNVSAVVTANAILGILEKTI